MINDFPLVVTDSQMKPIIKVVNEILENKKTDPDFEIQGLQNKINVLKAEKESYRINQLQNDLATFLSQNGDVVEGSIDSWKDYEGEQEKNKEDCELGYSFDIGNTDVCISRSFLYV